VRHPRVVTEDGVAVLRPVELVMLRPPTGSRFRYAGAGTFWDPPPADREATREVARRVGRALADRVGFRGAFGVDGILSEDGFVPTELNPRFAAGLVTSWPRSPSSRSAS
jgi:predicted ATP-grasp superfamily ATP-dependent carboligase